MFIQTEETPNPLSLKFLPGQDVMGDQPPVEFRNKEEGERTILSKKLFQIPGIQACFFGQDFITITKNPKVSWSVLKPDIFGTLVDYFTLHTSIDLLELPEGQEPSERNLDDLSQIEKEIVELLDARIRPAVAMDGGDIVFDHFEDGIVYLQMRGACSGCPSSTATLKSGIENMLKHYIPEVEEVRAMGTEDPFQMDEE